MTIDGVQNAITGNSKLFFSLIVPHSLYRWLFFHSSLSYNLSAFSQAWGRTKNDLFFIWTILWRLSLQIPWKIGWIVYCISKLELN